MTNMVQHKFTLYIFILIVISMQKIVIGLMFPRKQSQSRMLQFYYYFLYKLLFRALQKPSINYDYK